jgi:magnesium-transporting ATPase (P-type)
MTGSGTADCAALRLANVGLAMGSGCTVAKDNADMTLLDDDCSSVFHAIMWGRVIFDNIKKFLQFQLTVNVTLVLHVMITSLTLGRTNFNVVQFLWINLIMDTLGAVAICTEPYRKDSTDANQNAKARVRKSDRVLDGNILRSVITQSAYQLLVLLVLTYFGVFMFFDKTFNLIHGKLRDDKTNKPTDALVLNTIIFHTFVLMSLFNQVNCRVI